MDSSATAGGFEHPSILSPPYSTTSGSTAHSTLPHAREHPLKSGGSKESSFIRFVDQGIQKIQRRFVKRGSDEADGEEEADVKGYASFSEFAKDTEALIDLVWVSGTPSLEVPYLLRLASLVAEVLPEFPAAPKATFRVLDKLDLAFASLLQGRHIETGEPLSGFSAGRKVSGTEKVRMKSIVDQTRVIVMDVIVNSGDGEEEDEDDETVYMETGDEMEDVQESHGEDYGEREMGVARIYDRAVVELGDTMGGTPIGIITDD
ncbi:hypothetical protein E2P81_ATG00784 [Venturia nashicola]|uniref:Meiotic recombination protein dmc1 n=1 Tax=Venturia nashicola TaxID=86259 RepID=A0A4Z1PTI1_9PEZI|nr:hypothetical protein E6O75_ATG00802 [Venturia nashicola]TLD38241.1 hypothetical protein E2P81_ATG00784 [Venturia nashicola]